MKTEKLHEELWEALRLMGSSNGLEVSMSHEHYAVSRRVDGSDAIAVTFPRNNHKSDVQQVTIIYPNTRLDISMYPYQGVINTLKTLYRAFNARLMKDDRCGLRFQENGIYSTSVFHRGSRLRAVYYETSSTLVYMSNQLEEPFFQYVYDNDIVPMMSEDKRIDDICEIYDFIVPTEVRLPLVTINDIILDFHVRHLTESCVLEKLEKKYALIPKREIYEIFSMALGRISTLTLFNGYHVEDNQVIFDRKESLA